MSTSELICECNQDIYSCLTQFLISANMNHNTVKVALSKLKKVLQ